MARQSTTERALRHLIRRATRRRDGTMLVLLFHELGLVYEEEEEQSGVESAEKSGDVAWGQLTA